MTTHQITRSVPRIPQADLDDLQRRLAAIRWPAVIDEHDRGHGIAVSRVRDLVEAWRTGFDWRAVEAELDRLGQLMITLVDGRRLHALHAVPAEIAAGGLPVVLVHGWPDSLLRFTELIPRLTAAGHPVVAPSIPGFGFSDQPGGEMSVGAVAEDLAELMRQLGYSRYAVHGGDWGSAVATALAETHPESVSALHLSDIPWDKTFALDRSEASPAEQAFLDRAGSWAEVQTYWLANSYNPDTVSIALTDSPVGLLAWIAEMYQKWSEDPIGDEHVLALVSLLWLTNSVRSSTRLYSEPAQNWDETDDSSWSTGRLEVPTGFALFPNDLAGVPPREFAERFFAVQRFTVMPRGGHFAALEQPDLMAEDLIGFLAQQS